MQEQQLKQPLVEVQLPSKGHAQHCKMCATISGATAGAVGVLVGQPFDTLKVRLQVSGAKSVASTETRSFVKTLAMYYRGSGPPVISSGLVSSLNFTGFEAIKRLFHREDMHRAPLFVHWVSGFGGAIPVTVITCPSQNIKILQQAGEERLGMIECLRKIFKTSGLRGLYRGYCIHSILETFGRGWYMVTYETVKRRLDDTPEVLGGQISLHRRMLAGACAGMAGWSSIYPLDVIRSRIMAQPLTEKEKLANPKMLFSNSLDCIMKTYSEGGIPIFFRGIGFSLVRAAPVAACVLPTYDLAYSWLQSTFGS
ncbi:hypothetical protein GUITHDRAFT_147022 [Guillardia theta CCMP2712]|uniref:Mitochondrial carrier protein n=1 Tax=Guillardia theta (strain CCMP2712) TaxID=905079 RepID=L1IFU2_GUITC|nr:hypothetical protein GUITHDRAFT_147022 [Guillardia theta CCMP2712]EKX34705.1 hypothetical protein GUITHDRAFT_147022 [Guillardia theta CCMP2712]|mmetsp:Transcript_215/g.485  ORF Transcript_215/g.485 Transcript_215/m.485 type:complete len:311 (-) Transcript_215:121-1053(-)|eukprot:XP_005821685.1 hypothetical protein GUITHDRAFT_147022 [Guillardia theta CCMP2712]